MNWDKVKAVIASVAPALAGTFGTPLAGLAVGALCKGLLPGKTDATTEDLAAVISGMGPADLVKVKEIGLQFEKDMKALDIDLEKARIDASVKEKASARGLFGINQWPQMILTLVYQTGVFVMLTGMLYYSLKGTLTEVPEFWKGVITTLITLVVQAALEQIRFWFGTSFGSQQKTELLYKSKPADPTQ